MNIFIKKNQVLSLIALSVFFSSQILPCLAQLVPAQPHIPIPVGYQHIPTFPHPCGTMPPAQHQHFWHTSNAGLSQTVTPNTHNSFPRYWHSVDSGNLNN